MNIKHQMWTVFEACDNYFVPVLETGSLSQAQNYAQRLRRKGVFDYKVKVTQKPKKTRNENEERE